MEFLLISPAQHQIHHSVARQHHDRNFGAALAVWDWMFGTLHLSEKQELQFDLGGKQGDEGDLKVLYLRPFHDIARTARRIVTRPFQRLRSDS
ncbi:MAG: hypothetical protein FalmKO_07910 [Falsiruegeria mediterranea]